MKNPNVFSRSESVRKPSHRRRERLRFELLEDRRLLSATSLPYQNPTQQFDVNHDLHVTALDALQIINFVGRNGSDFVLPEVNSTGRYPDVNGSQSVTELDALQIINGLVPDGPIVSARLLADSAPGDSNNLDFITSQYGLEFGVTYGDGTIPIEIRINGSDDDPFETIGAVGGLETITLSETQIDAIAGSALVDGEHRFEIRVGSAVPAHEFTVTVDTTSPAVNFDLDLASDTDPKGDLATEEDPVSLVGSTEPGAIVELVESSATTTADAAGDFRFDDVDLVDGDNSFTVRVTDVAGNADEAMRTITLGDLTPPILFAEVASDTGSSDSDGITSNATIAGTVSDSGSVTELRASFGISLSSAFFDVTADIADGAFSFDRARLEEIKGNPLADGSHTLRFVATDDSGNVSNLFELPFTLDTQVPSGLPNLADVGVGPAASVDVTFDRAVDDTALATDSYAIENAGTSVPATVSAVQRLSPTSVRLNIDTPLDDGQSYELTIGAGIQDIAGNQTASENFPFDIVESFRLTQVTPAGGEELVSVAREAIFRFSEEVDPSTVTSDAIEIFSLGEQVPGNFVVSTTGRFATFFPDVPWNPSTVVRMEVNGEMLKAADGDSLDADGDGISGGMLRADFRTLPLTRIAGTNVFGFLRDSFTGDPIVGATVRVDAFPDANVVTDENGRFELQDMPAPDFFVHFDGSTATSAPSGTVYPNVGKPLHSVPGQTIQLESNLQPFDVFLPPMAVGDIQALSATEPTDVGFGDAGKANLAAMFPEVDPSVWERTTVGFAPNGAVDDQGNPATQAAIIPVPPDRIPAPLPPFLDPELVISIQASGATNFDIPAPVTFPNLEGLAPGEQVLLFSFNHDAGRWDVNGTATVSADGLMVQSDPGVGIVAPGWHTVQAATQHTEEVEEPKPGVRELFEASTGLARQLTSAALNAASAFVSLTDTAAPGLGQLPLIDPILNAISATLGVAADIVDDGKISGSTIASVDLALIGILNPDPVSGTIIDGLGLGLTLDSLGQNTVAIAQAGRQLLDLLQDTADWEITLTDLSDAARAHAENFILLSDGVEVIRAVNNATGQQPTEDPILIEQYLSGLDKITRAAAYFKEQPGGNISGAYAHANQGYQTFFRQFGEVFDDRLDPAAGRPYDVSLEDGTPLARGVTDLSGKINTIIPPNERIVIRVVLPLTGGVMTRTVTTGASGSSSTGQTFLFPTDGDDADGDGLYDGVEEVLGTQVGQTDSDADVINDRAEVEQGLNPLDGRAFPTGIISSIPLLGEAKEIFVTEGLAYLARGSNGVSILDVSQFSNPILLGQFGLPGFATDVVAEPTQGIAAVSANVGGLHLVDVSDPVRPTLLRTVDIAASQLELHEGVIYATVGDALVSIDLVTGDIINTVSLGGAVLTDVTREGRMLYTMDEDLELRAIESQGFDLIPKGSLTMPQGAGQLFVGNGVAYIAAVNSFERGGIARADVSDPDNLTLIGGSPFTAPNFAPGTAIVTNGSGLGLLAGAPLGLNLLNLIDLAHAQPSSNDSVVGQFVLPGAPEHLSIASGLAFVTDSVGLQVINYRPFDTLGVAPTITISSPIEDTDPVADGDQVAEGTTIPIDVVANDDVQVRKVELLVNGELAGSDITFPWDLSAPALSDGSDVITLQARAIDTGGNETLSDPVTFNIIPDVDPPTITSIKPADGASLSEGLRAVRIRFSESMSAATINSDTIRLLDELGMAIPPVDLRLREDDRFVQLTYPPLPIGDLQIVIDGLTVTDRAGVPLGSGDITSDFSLTEPIGGNSLFPGPIYKAGFIPKKFASGDLDFDGDQDLVAIDSGNKGVSVALNNGDGSFVSGVPYLISEAFTGSVEQLWDVAIADANDDGDLDVIALYQQPGGNFSAGLIAVFPGNGDGTLGEAVTFDAGSNPKRIATEDFNNDGAPDVLVTGFNGIRVLINDGSGNFAAPFQLTTVPGAQPQQAVPADLNNDNNIDVVLASLDFTGTQSVSFYPGNGDGTFGDRTDFAAGGSGARAIAVDDLNDDDNLDVVVATNRALLSVLLGNGDGTFGTATDFAVSDKPEEIAIGDINNDGIPDLITPIDRKGTVENLLGNGDGTFGDFAQNRVPNADFLIAGHFNRDSNLDVIAYVADINGIYPLLGNGDGTFANLVAPEPDFRLEDPVLVDIDGDDRLDIVGRSNVGIEVRLSNPDGTFALPSNLGFARSFTLGDIDDDGDLDLVHSNTSGTSARVRTISVFSNDGTGIWTPLTPFGVRPGSGPMQLALMDADDNLDLVFTSEDAGNTGDNHIVVHPGNGDGTFGTEFALLIGANENSIRFELDDVNNDDKLDVVVITGFHNVVTILEGNGDGTLGNRTDITIGSHQVGQLELADLDSDGNVDLVLTGAAPIIAGGAGAASVLLGNGDGTFGSMTHYRAVPLTFGLAIADINDDNIPDLLVTNGVVSASSITVFVGIGDGTFQDGKSFLAGSRDNGLVVGDLNGDDVMDVLTSNPTKVTILLGNNID